MRLPTIDDRVRLTQAIPELSLPRGVTGTVRSTWFAPSIAYEVEFEIEGSNYHTHALVLASQVEIEFDATATEPALQP